MSIRHFLQIRFHICNCHTFERIKFEDYELADYHEYFPKKKERDEKARSNYRKLLEEDDIEGLFMRDILREEIKADDPRLQ